MKKIVFFDIDGTLLDHNKKLPDSTKMAIAQLQNNGIYTAIATGRGPFMVYPILEELKMDAFVSYNGQLAVYKDDIVFKNPLSTPKLEKLEEVTRSFQHSLVYMGMDRMYSNIEYDERIAQSVGTLQMHHPQFLPDYYQTNDIFQSLLFIKENEEEYLQQFVDDFEFVRWHDLAIDILPKGGSKAAGITQLINKLGFKMEDVYAFGDGLNDIEMLGAVGTGVAMGNALDEVKSHADVVTDHVDQDGILKGLKIVGLL